MEAEQSRNNREYPVVFGQKRVKMVVDQLVWPTTLCCYSFQVHPFLARNATGAAIFGHCPRKKEKKQGKKDGGKSKKGEGEKKKKMGKNNERKIGEKGGKRGQNERKNKI